MNNYLRFVFCSAVIAGFLITAASNSAAQSSHDTVDLELQSLRDGLVQAFERRDVEAMLSFTSPEVIVTWQNAEVSRGQLELRNFINRMLSGPDSVVTEVRGNPSVEARKYYGDEVISIGQMNDEFTLRATGQTLKFNSRFSALLVREDGKLLLGGLHLSVNAFDNPLTETTLAYLKGGIAVAGAVGLLVGVLLSRLFFRKRSH